MWADGCLLAAMGLTVARAVASPSEPALLTALGLMAGGGALLLLPRVLTGTTATAGRRLVVGIACAQVLLMLVGWDSILASVGLGVATGSRYGSALTAVALPLASPWLWPLLALGLLVSQSYLAVAAALIGLAAAHLQRPDLHTTRARVVAASWLVAGGVGLGLVLALFSAARGWPLPGARLTAWALAWPDLAAHPWLGLGPGAWTLTIPMRQWGPPGTELWGHAHSEPIEWAYEHGLVGLALLGGWLAAVGPRLWRSPVRGAAVAIAVLAAGLHVFRHVALAPWLVLVLGIGLRSPDPPAAVHI